jgi:predicted enzyme related to lactoylglutathione lyase
LKGCTNAKLETEARRLAQTERRLAATEFTLDGSPFGDASKMWMLNLRVRDLDKMAAQLKGAGIEVKIDPQSYPIGRFARLHDPEGNPIELWQLVTPEKE